MRRKFNRRERKPSELMLVPMIDIFTVLVTFLLMTAVFSRITIVELDLPSAASAGASEPTFRLEVIVRAAGLELTNGSALIATIPKTAEGAYDLAKLTEFALALKRDYPDADDASVLLEPEIVYDDLIQVMDAIRSTDVAAAPGGDATGTAAETPAPDGLLASLAARPTRFDLFTDIAVGDAP